MGLSLRNTGFLRQLALHLREAPKVIQARAAAEIKTKVEELVDQGFATKTDPYGKKWQPPKDGGPTMERTGDLRRGFRVLIVKDARGVGMSLQIVNAQDYAQWLQRGTEKMAPRKMTPDTVIPEAYKRVFKTAYERAVEAWYASTKR